MENGAKNSAENGAQNSEAHRGNAILGIETSCDETAAAVVAGGQQVLSSVVSSQVDLHARYGGVVPEVAGRAHVERLVPVMSQALVESALDDSDIAAVAATSGPGLVGALLVGVSAAKALALVWDVPFVAVNHLEAHLHAAFLDEPSLELPWWWSSCPAATRCWCSWRTACATGSWGRPSTTPPARPSTRWPATWASAIREVP